MSDIESFTVKSAAAVAYMMKKLNEESIWWQLLIITHDEVQFLVKDEPDAIQRAEEIAKEAFSDTGEVLMPTAVTASALGE